MCWGRTKFHCHKGMKRGWNQEGQGGEGDLGQGRTNLQVHIVERRKEMNQDEGRIAKVELLQMRFGIEPN
ncbi:hypothetical protein X953_01325 [Virgibacillus sp. SK37]|nr:hypothetical protein X953_01325 [Virgibacillus sp. SK37]